MDIGATLTTREARTILRRLNTITRPGYGRYSGGSYITSQTFVDEKKARDYYTDCLVRYPNYNVKFLQDEH